MTDFALKLKHHSTSVHDHTSTYIVKLAHPLLDLSGRHHIALSATYSTPGSTAQMFNTQSSPISNSIQP